MLKNESQGSGKLKEQEPIVFGVDLAVNHWGICQVDYRTGECTGYKYMTDKKFEYAKHVMGAYLLKEQDKKGGESKENYEERRKDFSVQSLLKYINAIKVFKNGISLEVFQNIYIAIEGFAYAAPGRGVYQIAEMVGLFKAMLYKSRIKIRIYDPFSIKLYATGRGNCLKKEMVENSNICGFTIPSSLVKQVVKKSKRYGEQDDRAGIGTDLADAFFLARMLRTELLLREGVEDLKNLKETERKIFLRTTEAFPENILSRPFIYKGETE